MTVSRRLIALALLVALPVVGGSRPAIAGPPLGPKCYGCKLRAIAKAHACVLGAAVNEQRRNKSFFEKIFVDCREALETALAKCVKDAAKKGLPCPPGETAADLWFRLFHGASDLASAAGAVTDCCSLMPAPGSSVCWATVFGVTPAFCAGQGGSFLPGGVCDALPTCQPGP